MSIDIFEDREARQFFVECTSAMDSKQKQWFVRQVKSLFDDKTISEEGEFDCFKVTKDDLLHLASCVTSEVCHG